MSVGVRVIPTLSQMTFVGLLMIALLGKAPVLASRMENLFTPCTSAQLKLTSPQSDRLSQVTCSILCKNRKCDGYSYVDGECSLDDNTLPEASAVTVTEGSFLS